MMTARSIDCIIKRTRVPKRFDASSKQAVVAHIIVGDSLVRAWGSRLPVMDGIPPVPFSGLPDESSELQKPPSMSGVVLASVYAFLRWLELNDIVDVKWENLRRLVGKTTKLADLNGDGKIDAKDLKLAKAKAVGFFGSAVPSASGLCAGIAIGLKL